MATEKTKLTFNPLTGNFDIVTDVSDVAPLTQSTAGRVLQSNSSTAAIETSNVTNTELGYVSGVTSSIQSQITAKFTLPTLTSGSIIFSDGSTLTQKNSNLFWDNTNNRLGIGNNAPGAALQVNGSIWNFGSGSSPGFWMGENISAVTGSAYGTLYRPTLTATANSDLLINMASNLGVVATGTFTSTNFYGMSLDFATWTKTGTGTVAVATGLQVTAPTFGGTNYAALITGGNVGIGTTAPQKTLSINGAMELIGGYGSLPSAQLRPVFGGGGSSPNAGSVAWGDNTGYKFHFGTSVASTFTPRVTFVDSGNVGIGTQSPAQKLDISQGNIVLDNTFGYQARLSTGTIANLMSYNSGNSALIGPNNEIILNGSALINPPGQTTIQSQIADSASAVNVIFNTPNPYTTAGARLVAFRNNGVQKAFIDKDGGAFFNGKTGIGTSTPTRMLSVSGTGVVADFTGNGATAIMDILSTTTANALFRLGYNSGTGYQVGVDGTTGDFNIQPGFGGAFTTPVFTMKSGGRIGIGTYSPNASSALDITSTTQGFLPPRMTTIEKNAITSPTAGLMVYDSTLNHPFYYNGTTWVQI